jgi:O-antigen/teichoic acid export membrane protein
MIRLTGTPLASILIGTGHQRLLILTPIVEAFTNLAFSIGLGIQYGAIGVAWGTLIGGVAVVTANICYNLPRVRRAIECSPFRYLSEAMIVPMLCGIPFFLAVPVSIFFPSMSTAILASGAFVSFCICGIALFKNGVKDVRSGWAAGGEHEKE